jgi:hypothetical protein
MRLFVLIAPPVLVSILFWTAFVACIDGPSLEAPPSVRIVVSWDPLACGAPHRVAIELEDEAGVPISSSAPCALGGLTLEAPHFGVYLGRVYAWTAGQPIRSIMPVRLHVDEPIVRWMVATPE